MNPATPRCRLDTDPTYNAGSVRCRTESARIVVVRPSRLDTGGWTLASGKVELRFNVGEIEKHQVRFVFDQTWGRVRIWVDDHLVVKGFEMLNFSTVRTYEFAVGTDERHQVEIVKTRKRWGGGLRKQSIVGRVDGNEVASI